MITKSMPLQIFILFLLGVIFSIKGDGYFPFPSNIDATVMSVLSALQVGLVFGLLLIFLFPSRFSSIVEKTWRRIINQKFILRIAEKRKSTMWIIAAGIAIAFNTLTFLLYLRDFRNFSEIYKLNLGIWVLIYLLSIALILIPILTRRPKLLLFTVFLSSFVLSLIPMIYFPITAHVGDLLPIVQEQSRAFLTGESIYQYFMLDNGIATQAVRQPGIAIFYSPGTFLNIDLRIISQLYVFAALAILLISLYKTNAKALNKHFSTIVVLVLLFLLLPYRMVRLDLYEPPFWLLFSLFFAFIMLRKYIFSSLIIGFGIFTQVWFWLLAPLYSVYLLRTKGAKFAIMNTLLYLLIGVGAIWLFVNGNPAAYVEHTLTFYSNETATGSFVPFSYYLTPLFHIFKIESLLMPVQIVSVFLLGILALFRLSGVEGLIKFFILTYFVFIQFNSLTWNYFYINLIFLMMIFLFVRMLKDERGRR